MGIYKIKIILPMKIILTESNWKELLFANKGSQNIGNVFKAIYKNEKVKSIIIKETAFCEIDTSILFRLKYILNGQTKMNECLECKKLINDGGKTKFCSNSCMGLNYGKDKELIKRRSKSMSKTYSLKSEEQKQQIRDNRKNSMLEKYGVVHNFNIEGFKEKRAETWKNNHGEEVAQKAQHIKDKTRITCEERYGGPNPLSDPNVKQKWLNSFFYKYGEINPMNVDSIKRKTFVTKYNISLEDVVFMKEKLLALDKFSVEEYIWFVRILTEETLSKYGKEKFGESWRTERGKFKKHVDHMLSIRSGYLNDIDPYIIADIENLNLIDWSYNLSKGCNDDLSINELLNKIKINEKN